ncbi:MAG: ATP-binding protein [Polyangiales bacterium]
MTDPAEELRRLRERFHVLCDAGSAFTEATGNHNELLARYARRISDVTGDLCGAWITSEDGQWVHCVGLHDPSPEAVERARHLSLRPLRVGDFPLVNAVLSSREALFLPELDGADDLDDDVRASLAQLGARSALVVPLRCKGAALGAVALIRWKPDRAPYDDSDWDFVQCVADQAALAMQNAALLGAREAELSERKRAEAALARSEEQLHRAQKMDALGRLAGGVAHGFNNILSVVLSYSELILDGLAPDDPIRADLYEIRRAGEQASDLTRQLIAFSRRQVVRPRALDLDQALASMEAPLRSVLGDDVELTLRRTANLWNVRADPGQVEHMIMNLAANAHEAMPLGGKLTIETANVDLDADAAREHMGATPGPFVRLTVSDTGHGMDRETLDRIFEPFFSTKNRGPGAGLGLATVFAGVRQSGGHIQVFSELGLGTTFRIFLPRDDADARGPSVAPRAATEPPGRGALTVLLVEDDPQVRTVVCGILTRAGHDVLVAESPADALEIAERQGARINLLLTDVVMPRMSGPSSRSASPSGTRRCACSSCRATRATR